MITVYASGPGGLRRAEFAPGGALPDNAIWLDLSEPTPEEQRAAEAALDIDAPSREEMQEIELSSRVYREGGASYLTASVLYNVDVEPDTTAITFIRTPRALVTVRYAEPKVFKLFTTRAARQGELCANGDAVLLGLLDGIIDRCADILERIGADMDALSRKVFSKHGARKAEKDDLDLEEIVRRLGRSADLTSKVQQSLSTLERILIFLGTPEEKMLGKDYRQRVKTLHRDAHSLTESAAFLAHKSNFLLDATLGLIDIEQTAIIKIFSVAAVVFLPPTLIASIYGMNFDVMPELHWTVGYPLALALMVGSAILPYWYFKRKGWL